MAQLQVNDIRVKPVEAHNISSLIRLAESEKLSPWTAQCYLDEMKNPDSVMLRLISDDNSTLGFVVGRFVPSGSGSLDAEIYNIAIRTRDQRSGFGQILFDAFADKCRQRNAENIWLEVRESNEKAIAFYTKNGFERVQTRNHFYENPREHGWLMRLVLQKSAA